MTRRLVHGSGLFLLGLTLASLAAGCGDPNEMEFREGTPGKPGYSDPKAVNTPQSYQERYAEARSALKASPKGKPAAAKAKAQVSPESKEASQAPTAESEKKP